MEKEIEEAETLSTQIVVKEQLKVVQILETFVCDDTNIISNAWIEPKSFVNVNCLIWIWTALNFMFPHPNHFHKAQSTKPNIEQISNMSDTLFMLFIIFMLQ